MAPVLFLAAMLSFSFAAATTPQDESKALVSKTAHVNCSLVEGAPPVAIMAEPKLSATVVGTVKCGEEVRTLSSDQSAWTKIVTPDGIEGYITSSVLTPIESKGNIASGALRVGGPVTAPRAVYAPDPEYPEEARKAHYQGSVVLRAIVGADGGVRAARVSRPLGMGLDEKALETVRTWKFEPATKDGRPVAVEISVEVYFRLYADKTTLQQPGPPAPQTTDTKFAKFPGVDRMKYPFDVSVEASRTQYDATRNTTEMAVQLWDGSTRKGYTIGCASDSGNCSLLTAGTYPARWTKGKLEVIGWRLGSQKTYKSEYTIVAENCEMPFTCR